MSTTSATRRKPRSAGPGAADVRWQREVPEAIRAFDTLTRFDYADIVTARVPDGDARTPDERVLGALRGVPGPLRGVVPFIQRVILGLRLETKPSRDHLFGWKIADRGDTWMRLEASSWFLTGHIVLHDAAGRLSFATFVRYDRAIAAVVWPPVSIIHRYVAIALVRSAVKACP
jgi:hypothetical protein